MGQITLVYPNACPHCGKSIATLKPVGEKTLQAAREILLGCENLFDISAKLKISTRRASDLLYDAERAKLIRCVRTVANTRGGMPVKHYAPQQKLRAFFRVEYDAWSRAQAAQTRAG